MGLLPRFTPRADKLVGSLQELTKSKKMLTRDQAQRLVRDTRRLAEFSVNLFRLIRKNVGTPSTVLVTLFAGGGGLSAAVNQRLDVVDQSLINAYNATNFLVNNVASTPEYNAGSLAAQLVALAQQTRAVLAGIDAFSSTMETYVKAFTGDLETLAQLLDGAIKFISDLLGMMAWVAGNLPIIAVGAVAGLLILTRRNK